MIRKATLRDVPAIAHLLAQTKTPWSEKSVESSIEYHSVLVYGDVDGVLIYSSVCGEAEILNFAVKPEMRRRGIGGSLLDSLTEKAVCLDVRKSNDDAISLYKKHGFEVTGMRCDFYDNPTEDAVLMSRIR